MKTTILILAALLAACSDSAQPLYFPAMPPELADCKMFIVTNSSGARVTVARCPNSTTSTTVSSGKSTATAVVVDGVPYAPAGK